MEEWLRRSVQADLAIGPAANLVLGNKFVRPEVERIVAATPGVHYDSYRELRVRFDGQLVKLVSARLAVTRDIERLAFTEGESRAGLRCGDPRRRRAGERAVPAPVPSRPWRYAASRHANGRARLQNRRRLRRLHHRGRRDPGRLADLPPVLAGRGDQRHRRVHRQGLGRGRGAPAGRAAHEDRAPTAITSSSPTRSCASRSSASSTRRSRSPTCSRPSASSSPASGFS
ncbi:MAG: hypothetical protein WDO13_05125 [Verrucomicrobiota bacterium]